MDLWKKKTPLVVIPIIGLILGVVIIAFDKINQPANWENLVDSYLTYKNTTRYNELSISKIDEAQKPWNFKSYMSALSYSDSINFQVDIRNDFYQNGTDPSKYPPLPYPPNKLWCIRLNNRQTSINDDDTSLPNIIVVALHSDLYNADYVIHEMTRLSQNIELNSNLNQIGCSKILD
jgi:hypothetical protein